MTPWQVIEEALLRHRPPRGPKWLADALGESIQTVSNWKARGVPPRRFREIAKALGLTVDQIEGLDPPPWEKAPPAPAGLLPEVSAVAAAINELPPTQRSWVLSHTLDAIDFARQTVTQAQPQETADKGQPRVNPRRK